MRRLPKDGLRIIFLHPDLGIGGAERLVVDAAVGLQDRGHSVKIYTSHHDPEHCFSETKDGTLDVEVRGDWLPNRIPLAGGRLVCAILRQLYACLWIMIQDPCDIIVMDQLSLAVPILRRFHPSSPRVLFYCHFPDQLLTERAGLLKRIYRAPLDWLEEVTTGDACGILVNSEYTKTMFAATFKRLAARGVVPRVLYPAINLSEYDPIADSEEETEEEKSVLPIRQLSQDRIIFLSINRFQREKDHGLAIRALQQLLQDPQLSPADKERLQLVIAGGHDPNNPANHEYYRELWDLCGKLGMKPVDFEVAGTAAGQEELNSSRVLFLRSFNEAQRLALLERCSAVLYTPTGEHFGIVPVEAMYSRRPCVAVDSGGPRESILHRRTGFLCEANPEAFSEAMRWIVLNPKAAAEMGEVARQHVRERFSLEKFADKLDVYVWELHHSPNLVRKMSKRSRLVLMLLTGVALLYFVVQHTRLIF